MTYTGPDGTLGPWTGLQTGCDDGVLTVSLEAGTALTVAACLQLDALLATVAGDAAVRLLVLSGRHGDFCTGLDDADFADGEHHGEASLRAAREFARGGSARALHRLPQPVIAVVHGVCAGAAITLLAGCDIVLAADDARFSLPPGLPDPASVRTLAPRAASYHALSGLAFDGAEAERNGLVTRSLPTAALEAETRALVAELLAKDADALRFTKEMLQHAGAMSWDGALSFHAAKLAELKALQAGRPSARAVAVASFLAGKSKPGLGG